MHIDFETANKIYLRTLRISKIRSRLPGANRNQLLDPLVTINVDPSIPGLNNPVRIFGQVTIGGAPIIGSKISLLIDGQVVGFSRVSPKGYAFSQSFGDFGNHTIQVSAQLTPLRQKNSDIKVVQIVPFASISISAVSPQVGQQIAALVKISDNTGNPVKAKYDIQILDSANKIYLKQSRITNPDTGQDTVNFVPNIDGLWTVQITILGETKSINVNVIPKPTPQPPVTTGPPPLPGGTGATPPSGGVPPASPPPAPPPQPSPPSGGTGQVEGFNASPVSGMAPLKVVFTSSAIGGLQPYYKWSYDFGDGIVAEDSNAETAHLSSSTISHVYALPGTYNAVLTITDAMFNTITSQPIVITVLDNPMKVSVTVDPQQGFAPLDVTCRAVPQGGLPPYDLNWNYGDGSPEDTTSGDGAVHQYTRNGQYTVTGTLIDAALKQVTGTAVVTVGAAQVPSTAITLAMPLSQVQNGQINIIGRATNNTPNVDITGIMVVQLIGPNGSIVGAQQRQVTVLAGRDDNEAFLFQPQGPGAYIATLQFWADPQGSVKLGQPVTQPVQVT